MNEKTIAAIALNNADYPSLEAKLREAVPWIELAAHNGADLVVLPETLTTYRGDGPGNPTALTHDERALDDWETAAGLLLDAARRCRVALTIPVLVREEDGLANTFFLVSKDGSLLGRYNKMRPTLPELEAGVRPGGDQPLIPWEGLRVGGAICFDTLFEDVFRLQAARGADLFLVPSLWPGGDHLNYYALRYATPIALSYPAWSRLIDIAGRDIAAGGYRNETLRFGFGAPIVMATVNFDRVALYGNNNQERMVAVQRRYGRRVRVEFIQQNALWLLESRDPDLPVAEVMREFELEACRDYLADCEQAVLAKGGVGTVKA